MSDAGEGLVDAEARLQEQMDAREQLKAENLQRAGSFKVRGAYVRMARLSEEEKARGVVAASAGNHAQGVALAASMVGIAACPSVTTVFYTGTSPGRGAWIVRPG